MTGIFRRCASTTSGFAGFTADVTTTTSAFPTFAAAWPWCTTMPKRDDKRSVMSDFFASDPVTEYPRFASSSAMPLIPMPPMPTKCTRRVLPSTPLAPRPSPLSLLARQREQAIDDDRRGVGPRQPARRPCELAAARWIFCERGQLTRLTFAHPFLLLHHHRRTLPHECLRVSALVIVCDRRQRHEDRRFPRGSQLRQRRR